MCFATLTLGIAFVAFQGRNGDYKHEREAKLEVEEYYGRYFSSKPIKVDESTIDVSKLWDFAGELARFCDADHPFRIRALAELLKEKFDPSPEGPNKVNLLSALIDATRRTSKEMNDPDRQALLESLIGILERRWANRKGLGFNQVPALLSLFDALPERFIADPEQRRRVIEVSKSAVLQFSNEREWRTCRSAVVCWRRIGLDDDPQTWETLRTILERVPTSDPNPKDEIEIVELKRALIDAFADFGYGERRRLKEERRERSAADDSAKLILEMSQADDRWAGIADLLRGFLHDKEKAIRLSAVKALGRIGPPSAEGAIDLLSERLDPHLEREFEIRYASAISLKRIGLNQKAVRALLRSLNDPDPDFRDVAAEALEKVGPDVIPGVLRAVDEGLTQFDPDRILSKENPAETPEVPQRIQDARARKKRADRVAVQLLAWNADKRPDDKMDERLGVFLVDPDPIVRERASAALSRRGDKALRYFTKAMALGNADETRLLGVDRIAELAKGLSADSSKEQFDALIKLFDEPNPDPILLLKASKALDVVCNNIVDASSKGTNVDKTRQSMAEVLSATIAKLRDDGSSFAEVVEALETRQKVVTPPERKPTTLWQALVELWNLAYQTYPVVSSTILLAIALYVICAIGLLGLFVIHPGWIVSFREWAILETRKRNSNKLLRPFFDLLMQPASPVRWWDGNSRILDRWVLGWLPTFRKNLNIDDGTVRSEAVAICTGEPCEAVEPTNLDVTIARAFTKSRSGILILGEDEAALDWITKYIARWAIGDRRGNAASIAVGPTGDSAAEPAADYPPMLPVIIKESEIVTRGQSIPDKALLRQRVRRAIGELIRQNYPPISRELHADLVVNRRLLVICKADPETPAELTAFIQLLQEDYKDWVVTTRDLEAYNTRLFAHRVTMMKIRARDSEAGRFGCRHDHQWGAALCGIFETWKPGGTGEILLRDGAEPRLPQSTGIDNPEESHGPILT